MNVEKFMPKWIKYSGWLEIVFGIMFALVFPSFMDYVQITMQISFWIHMTGISLMYMGVLLYWSALDIQNRSFVIFISCIFRFTVVLAEIYCMIQSNGISPMAYLFSIPIGIGCIYDGGSAVFTLMLLKKLNLLKFKKK
jgi:hypothetical protein